MSRIRKSLLHTVFSGFNMRRWNDKLRPTELYEIDKQAHKMIIAFILAYSTECESEEHRTELLHELIECSLFDYFYRIVTTDLKPPLFYQIKANKNHYQKLTLYVERELQPILEIFNDEFFSEFKKYHKGEKQFSHTLTEDILKASHLFASEWEFNLIKDLNKFDAEIQFIEKDFKDKLSALTEVDGLAELKNILDSSAALGSFAHFCGQLRFQLRWSQEPRLPLTSVLGHMFFVATMAYFVSIDVGACKKLKVNNFFCGLFHDLPELLTRDIITPVKNSSKELPDFIKEYEHMELNRKILNPLSEAGYTNIVNPLTYLLGLTIDGEFKACYTKGDKIVGCTTENIYSSYNRDECNPKDGELIKACDVLGAFMEAHTSIRHGVSSSQILEASIRIRSKIPNPLSELIDFKALLADFD